MHFNEEEEEEEEQSKKALTNGAYVYLAKRR
jgi:hypothetical protein